MALLFNSSNQNPGDRYYAKSVPLDRNEYSEVFSVLREIAKKNKFKIPEIRVVSNPEGLPPCVFENRQCIFVGKNFLENFSQKNIAYYMVHEIAHLLIGNVEIPSKACEFTTDRVAAAMIGDESAYRAALEELQKWRVEETKKLVQKFFSEERSEADVAQFNASLNYLHAVDLERYSTPEDRSQNVEYDEIRRKIAEEALPLAQDALKNPKNPDAVKLEALAEQFNLDRKTMGRLTDNAIRAGNKNYSAANVLASYISTNVMQQRKSGDTVPLR